MSDFASPLREQDVDDDPFRQFEAWFDQATATGMPAPEAAALATATSHGEPSVRMVLVKQVDQAGLVFYSNYQSRKGDELRANPRAALLFYWEPLGRQVRVEGRVQRTSAAASAAYVRRRSRGSQLSALASPQSRPVASRDWLEQRVAELDAAHAGVELPLPDGWGGFRLIPASFEFWQQREDRLHDRLRYLHHSEHGWSRHRLAP